MEQKSNIETALEKLIFPITLTPEPNLVTFLMLNTEPKCNESNKLMQLPNLTWENTDRPEPNLVNPLIDTVEPYCVNERTDNVDPNVT